jgi:hypothetical protein
VEKSFLDLLKVGSACEAVHKPVTVRPVMERDGGSASVGL